MQDVQVLLSIVQDLDRAGVRHQLGQRRPILDRRCINQFAMAVRVADLDQPQSRIVGAVPNKFSIYANGTGFARTAHGIG